MRLVINYHLQPSTGPTVCETVYESECETHYHVHDVEDDTPDCTEVVVSCHQLLERVADGNG